MKRLVDIGYIKKGMVLVDKDGLEGEITDITGDPFDPHFILVELNGNEQAPLMWDWDRVRDDVYVKDGTY